MCVGKALAGSWEGVGCTSCLTVTVAAAVVVLALLMRALLGVAGVTMTLGGGGWRLKIPFSFGLHSAIFLSNTSVPPVVYTRIAYYM